MYVIRISRPYSIHIYTLSSKCNFGRTAGSILYTYIVSAGFHINYNVAHYWPMCAYFVSDTLWRILNVYMLHSVHATFWCSVFCQSQMGLFLYIWCMCLMVCTWVQMVALECSRTSVLVSILSISIEHSHSCFHVYMMYVRTYIYDAVILFYVYM